MIEEIKELLEQMKFDLPTIKDKDARYTIQDYINDLENIIAKEETEKEE